ncbi:MAG: hypothetical protein ACI9W2_003335, partial [Gammaproteobacteria bacterium]
AHCEISSATLLEIHRRHEMTLCPIALVASCKQCPAFNVCPLKGVIGDYEPDSPAKPVAEQEDEETKSK